MQTGQACQLLPTAVTLICRTGSADSLEGTTARMKRDIEPQEPSAGPGVTRTFHKCRPSSHVSASFSARPLRIDGNRHSAFLQPSPGIIRAASRRDNADEANSMNSVFVAFSPSVHGDPSPPAPDTRHLTPAWRAFLPLSELVRLISFFQWGRGGRRNGEMLAQEKVGAT